MRRTTTAAWAAVLCSTVLSSAGCDPVVPFRVPPHDVGLAVYIFDSSTDELVLAPAHVVATSSEASYELDRLGDGSYFGVREPGVYTVYVEADGYAPAVLHDIEIVRSRVGAVEGFQLVSPLVCLDPVGQEAVQHKEAGVGK